MAHKIDTYLARVIRLWRTFIYRHTSCDPISVENFPNTAIEHCLANAFDVCGTKDVCRDQETGFYLPVGDSERF